MAKSFKAQLREYARGPLCLACGTEIDVRRQPQGFLHWAPDCLKRVPPPFKQPLNCEQFHDPAVIAANEAYELGATGGDA